MKPKIYVAGPYTKDDVAVNVKNAFKVGTILAERGFAPFIPHFTHFWHMMFPQPYKFWLELDEEFLLICDAIYRMEGISAGADHEIEIAKKHNIPQFYNLDELYRHFNL